ncbi:fused MFS/spermidine synthase [Viridibacterium curvum]|uniref:Fused MFS/spermidine synthase n=1 Tax=Viridibacterium curvum TaxID=1101404 RepID=A0ABP9R608_9RHOO
MQPDSATGSTLPATEPPASGAGITPLGNGATSRRLATLIFAGTIFSSAFALFLVQPIIARQILPWFGGSAAVWALCMVFFQVVLLAGYAYSDWLTRRLPVRRQVLVHGVLLLTSLACLPIVANVQWKPVGDEEPTWLILRLLVATIGLPYFLLSTTGPLIQAWMSRTAVDAKVYRYFSLSNLASLLALLCYPVLLERHATTVQQAQGWSILYTLYVVLCLAAAWQFTRSTAPDAFATTRLIAPSPGWRTCVGWAMPAALASALLLGVSSHITQNVAAIPFLWVLPLTLYLFTFVLCFESDRWYRRAFWLPVAGVFLLLASWGLHDGAVGRHVQVAVPVYVIAMFSLCMVLHGEVATRRPGAGQLTRFYLMLSLGGATGGMLVGLIAPNVLPAYYELGLAMAGCAIWFAWLQRGQRKLAGAAAAIGTCTVACLALQVHDDYAGSRVVTRSFYGVLSTFDTQRESLGGAPVRQLFHGAIKHGEQILTPGHERELTSYYGESAGIGLAILNTRSKGPQHVGVIGLGAGTLAAYGRAGDRYRMYEINPEVIDIARSEFSFLSDSPAFIATVLGDARLALERETPQDFDVLAVDAFSGDAIPVHLITREALAVYLRHLRPGGIIAFHVTNRYLNLAPVVATLAHERGLAVRLVHDENENPRLRDTDWVLVSRDATVLAQPAIQRVSSPVVIDSHKGVWTDDFNNLFDVLR